MTIIELQNILDEAIQKGVSKNATIFVRVKSARDDEWDHACIPTNISKNNKWYEITPPDYESRILQRQNGSIEFTLELDSCDILG